MFPSLEGGVAERSEVGVGVALKGALRVVCFPSLEGGGEPSGFEAERSEVGVGVALKGASSRGAAGATE